MTNSYLFRPRSGYLFAGIVIAMSTVITAQFAFYGDFSGALKAGAWGLFASTSGYLLFIHPKVTLFDEGIRITNPLIEFTVGWDSVEEIEARYCMSISTGGRNIYAWAAPAPGRYHSRNIHSSDLKGLRIGNDALIRPGESPRTHSGAAAHLAKVRLAEFRQQVGAASIPTTIALNRTGIAGLSLSLGCSLLFYAIHL